ARLLAALAHNMYWFLVLRTDLHAARGDLQLVKGLRIGAAPGPDAGLKRLLVEAGLDLARDQIEIGPIPGTSAPGVSFVVPAQNALGEDPSLATLVGQRLFPPTEAELIAELIRRDLPYYDPRISEDMVANLNRFAVDIGLLTGTVAYDHVVATQFSEQWTL